MSYTAKNAIDGVNINLEPDELIVSFKLNEEGHKIIKDALELKPEIKKPNITTGKNGLVLFIGWELPEGEP